jgi:hypothetical protein
MCAIDADLGHHSARFRSAIRRQERFTGWSIATPTR